MHRLATADRVLLLVIMHQNREDRLLLAGPPHTVFISRKLARKKCLKVVQSITTRVKLPWFVKMVQQQTFTTPRSCRSGVLCCMSGVLHPLWKDFLMTFIGFFHMYDLVISNKIQKDR
jgi:hypothetical protein